jgi:hypothetical protein
LVAAIKKGFSSSSEWGPKQEKLKLDWIEYRREAENRKRLMIQNENHSRIQQIFYTFTGKYGYL